MPPSKPELISLPIDSHLPEILALLKKSDCLVLTAAPGAGKTTRLPPACLQAVQGQVLVLEPRRMAAVAAASRIAEENGWEAGNEVGWQVRFENRSSAQTRLLFLTEALLARRMLRDPELKGVDMVILDEFHERSLQTDLTLGLLKELREMGRNLKLIVMSATLTAERISAYLGGAPIISIPGQLFELQTEHQKAPQRLRTDRDFIDSVASAVQRAQSGTRNDLLVFLPGVGEIERTRQALEDWAGRCHIDLVPLHGSLPLEDQRRALRKGSRPRVVLSTNIAESSVTVDGVDTVIDSGLAKVNRFDVRTGFSRLQLGRISLNSAIQRSGRAARQFPGRSFRLWNRQDEMSMPKDEVPEIQRSDLAEALLFLAHHGVRDFVNFSWFESPPVPLIQAAQKGLEALGALDKDGRLTARGGRLLHFPLPPRIGALLLAAQEEGSPLALDLAARTAALLQERDFVTSEQVRNHQGDHLECDIDLRLMLLPQIKPKSVLAAADQIRRLAGEARGPKNPATERSLLLRQLILKAFPDRLCRRRGNSDRALMVGGRGLHLSPESLVKESEFFVALNGSEGQNDAETTVSLACGFSKDFILRHLADQIERKQDLFVDENKGQVYLREFRVFADLPLEEPSLSPAPPELIQSKLPELLLARWSQLKEKNEALGRWFERWSFFQAHDETLKDQSFTDERILEILTEAAYGEKSFDAVAERDLVFFFENALPSNLRDRLRSEVPDRIQVPSGSHLPVRYPEGREPYLEVRLQEIFGWMETPRILGGRQPLTIHLLGPNYRPVQVTADLRSFWQQGYVEVRKELRSRYPKHSWPDDPLTAKPEAKGRPRR